MTGRPAPSQPTPATGQPADALLSRTVRFCVNPDASNAGANGYAGRPAMRGLGRYYELTAAVRGRPDPDTGYILGIQDVDAAIRAAVIPLIDAACRDTPTREPAALLPDLWTRAAAALPRPLERLTWALTPRYQVEIAMHHQTQPGDPRPPRVLIRHAFDFAAAHRLHSPALSDDENRAVFGKCNNPSGHGHNYRVEPAVSIPADQADRFDLARLEAAVDHAVIAPFDHKHLNHDCPEFNTDQGGVIPSVERIAMVCHDRLAQPVRDLLPGAELLRVTVWETDRTSCTYPA